MKRREGKKWVTPSTFIKWPQIYAAEAEKLKGGIFNDRKCIKNFTSTATEKSRANRGQLLAKVSNGLNIFN